MKEINEAEELRQSVEGIGRAISMARYPEVLVGMLHEPDTLLTAFSKIPFAAVLALLANLAPAMRKNVFYTIQATLPYYFTSPKEMADTYFEGSMERMKGAEATGTLICQWAPKLMPELRQQW